MASNKLKITTYNCQGFGSDKVTFTSDLLKNCDILLLQEHWLFHEHFSDFYNIGRVNYHACSPMDVSSGLITGRPYGGCAIIWDGSANFSFNAIPCNNKRVCAGLIKFAQNMEILVINVYLPCDDGYRGPNYQVLVDTLNDIATIIMDSQFSSLIIGGDLNCDFSRSTPHVRAVSDFLIHNDIKPGIDHVLTEVDYTFESKSSHSRSCIDHFTFSSDLFYALTKLETCDGVDNFSDHRALTCELDININYASRPEHSNPSRPNWHKASQDDLRMYSVHLERLLVEVVIPTDAVRCSDPTCKKHASDIDNFYCDIADACLLAMDLAIPKSGMSSKRCMPGWNEHVKTKRQKSKFWHDIWIANDRPRQGAVADIMRKTRREYHYAIRHCRRHEQQITATNMARAMEHSNNKQFWNELKKSSRRRSHTAAVVDSINDPNDICDLFFKKFKDLYSSVPYYDHEVEDLKREIEDKLQQRSPLQNKTIAISADHISKILCKLKHYKYDGNKGLISDCLIYGPKRLSVLLCMLFNMMVSHGTVPCDFLLGTMVPIPKDKSLSHMSDKYRAITLSSSVGKLFDMLIIDIEGENSLSTDCLQFGFKSSSSTVLCTSVLQETICHFVRGGCNIYGLFLDASKAFDRINYTKLFKLLIAKGMDIRLVRCLLFMYTNQTLRVKWNDVVSNEFKALNGVKQGGVLSPLLFNVYVDELICQLRKSDIGCHVGPYYCSVFGYADDFCIIANSITDLRNMIQICENFAQEYNVMFNGSKSQLIKFSLNGDYTIDSDIFVCGCKVNPSREVIHLGTKLVCNPIIDNCDAVVKSFYKQYNLFISRFYYLPVDLKCKLFTTYCTSFYGLQICRISKSQKLHVAVRKCIRHMLGVPYRTHSKVLHCITNSLCMGHICQKRFLKFAYDVLNHKNDVFRFIFKLSISNGYSVFAKNIAYCAANLRLPVESICNENCGHFAVQICKNICRCDNDMAEAGVIIELIKIKEKTLESQIPTNIVDTLLTYICVN
jgi:hypothetical protein